MEMWNKSMQEITPKESVIMQLEICAATGVVFVAGMFALAGAEKIRQKLADRKAKKNEKALELATSND